MCLLSVGILLISGIGSLTLGAINSTFDESRQAEAACVSGTDSAVNGYYTNIGICNNHTVFIQENTTSFTSGESVYVLYYGTFTLLDEVQSATDGGWTRDATFTSYGFYLCNTISTYSVNGETDGNSDNTADCASPADTAGCDGLPTIYCSDYNDNYNYNSKNITSVDSCTQWKLQDDDLADEHVDALTFKFDIDSITCISELNTGDEGTVPDQGSAESSDDTGDGSGDSDGHGSDSGSNGETTNANVAINELVVYLIIFGTAFVILLVVIAIVVYKRKVLCARTGNNTQNDAYKLSKVVKNKEKDQERVEDDEVDSQDENEQNGKGFGDENQHDKRDKDYVKDENEHDIESQQSLLRAPLVAPDVPAPEIPR